MKKYLWLGFIGTVLSLVCDLLLGWMVYPDTGDYMTGMLAGCAELSYLRMGLSVVFGAIVIPMQYFGFKAIADIIGKGNHKKSKFYQKLVNAGAVATASMGASVHILCVIMMFGMRIECDHGFDPMVAATMLEMIPESVLQFTLWGVLPVSVIMMTPYMIMAVVMFWAIVRGRTELPKWMCICNPLIANLFTNLITVVIPNTAFSNGVGMASMALGGMLPFVAVLIWLYCKKSKVS